jgi:hypothetical protein
MNNKTPDFMRGGKDNVVVKSGTDEDRVIAMLIQVLRGQNVISAVVIDAGMSLIFEGKKTNTCVCNSIALAMRLHCKYIGSIHTNQFDQMETNDLAAVIYGLSGLDDPTNSERLSEFEMKKISRALQIRILARNTGDETAEIYGEDNWPTISIILIGAHWYADATRYQHLIEQKNQLQNVSDLLTDISLSLDEHGTELAKLTELGIKQVDDREWIKWCNESITRPTEHYHIDAQLARKLMEEERATREFLDKERRDEEEELRALATFEDKRRKDEEEATRKYLEEEEKRAKQEEDERLARKLMEEEEALKRQEEENERKTRELVAQWGDDWS